MTLTLKKVALLVLFATLIQTTAFAQRTFIKKIFWVNRSYLYHSNAAVKANQPLIIVLHPNKADAGKTFSAATQKATSSPVHLIFPDAVGGKWSCEEGFVKNDIALMKAIIADSYNNFQIDRNRVFILADTTNKCLAEKFMEAYPDLIAGSSILKPDETFEDAFNKILADSSRTGKTYKLWSDPVDAAHDEPANAQAKRQLEVSLTGGIFWMFKSVKTGISDATNADLSHTKYAVGLNVTRWISNPLGWFAEVSKIAVTERVRDTGIETKTGNGTVIPFTAGLKYRFFTNKRIQPYVLAGAGAVYTHAEGSQQTSGSSTSQVRNLNADYRLPVQVTLGAGAALNLGTRFILASNLRYLHSAAFSNLGRIDAVRGLNVNFSVGYVIKTYSKKGK
ncbi:outer membrane beta-barrel protein [Mucilaginibacter phyllosphaerae]|uniref:Outer membrane protein W n=1 Tax=Mucilaginibacter phyllosphaerae TaxID=1812349 RepID=A0A4Y8AFV5_9SPHI|nr:outer membrane beta-barrel protein [Mucilaginibacter phyllosphaerae]MBB3968731.1 outer membrane protein W [Mucilaginibacter phyllosphaerae]TEW67633.1 hypothetical protein E2R65_06490 [Mucilaginibacter phyllosphaerae]GGH14216.1 hypothetical protein GCM10007352_22190 [Mucilaginibacter phyllosphaerae]